MFDTILGVIAPHICLGCGAEENALVCEACVQSVLTVPSRCYRCRAVTRDYAVCENCRPYMPLRQVVVYAHHTGLAKELIHHAKYERAQSGLHEMAGLVAPLLHNLEAPFCLTHVPTASSRVRVRGYDHARLLAKRISRTLRLPQETFLARVGQAHQVGANRSQRLAQLNGAFRAVHARDVAGKHIVLVDDVLTTGATLETAARVLKQAGAKRVDAVVFAQA